MLEESSVTQVKANAAVYSIIETTKANNLDSYTYLTYIFSHLPGNDIEDIES